MHLQPGKASHCDAITWGTAIGGRNATVPEKAPGSVAAIGWLSSSFRGSLRDTEVNYFATVMRLVSQVAMSRIEAAKEKRTRPRHNAVDGP